MRRWWLVIVLVALVAACTKGGDDDVRSAAASSTTTTIEPSLPPGPLADRVADALAFIDEGRGSATDLFAPSFLEAVPEAQLLAIVGQQLHPAGPYTVIGVRKHTATSAEVLLQGSQSSWTMSIAIEAAPPNRITGMLLRPAPAEVTSWKELDEQLQAAAPKVALLAAEVVDGRCRAVHAVHADRVQPLGSAFKLYVLGALARAIQRGEVSWDDQVEVRDDLRVHSSQTYGTTPAGTKISVRDLAAAMISVSDNTATDLVMLHVGRDAIEQSLALLGMRDPRRDEPFVTTRELSLLKWGVPIEQRDAYVAADTAERRRMLDALPKHGATEKELTGSAVTPTEIEALEWFASPADLCRVHVALQELGAKKGLESVRSILSQNPGVPLGDEWTYVAFKGGSEPGVLAGSWLAERDDGRTFFVAALLENPTSGIDDAAFGQAAAAFSLFPR